MGCTVSAMTSPASGSGESFVEVMVSVTVENVVVTVVGWESFVTVAPRMTRVYPRMDPSAVDVASVCVESASAPFREPLGSVAKDVQPVKIPVINTGLVWSVTSNLRSHHTSALQSVTRFMPQSAIPQILRTNERQTCAPCRAKTTACCLSL